MSATPARALLNRFGKREKRAVSILAVFVAVYLGYILFLSPFLEKISWYERQTRQKEKDLAEWTLLKGEYLKLNGKLSRQEGRMSRGPAGFSFPVFLETAAAESRVKNRMTSVSPREGQTFDNLKITSLEVRLEDVTLAQAVEFISRIEKAPVFLYISQLDMKTRFSDLRNLDVTIVVSRYEKGS
ncbi:MAG TPA: hypothetical protein VN944_07370 [Nitrospiria bacterium]|nr:hypothetical protein [Nitrospiria bacterium]